MKFTQPVPFQEAVDKLGTRSVVGSKLRTKDWQDIPVAISDRAFFSAGIEDVRFLDNARAYLLDAVSGAKKTNERGETYYAMDRQKFVKEMQDYAVRNGIQPTGPGDLQDARSQTRLELIFDTQMKSAHDYGYWKQGQDQDILDAFPYQRFIRVTDVRTPRRRSERWEGIVRRKDDLDFWIMLNEDFGVPWGPWGYNSGMDVEDVAAEDAGEMIDRNPIMKDVLNPERPVLPVEKDFNDRLKASVRGISAEGRRHIEEAFGGAVQFSGDEVIFKNAKPSPAPEIPKPTPPPVLPKPSPAPSVTPDAASTILKVGELAAGVNFADGSSIIAANAQAHQLLSWPTPGKVTVVGPARKRPDVLAGISLVEKYANPKIWAGQTLKAENTRKRRSHYKLGTSTIFMSAHAGPSTVAHEAAHWLEDINPTLLAASKKFLANRAGNEPLVKLSKLTGNPNYDASERAWKDKWEERGGSVYAGKFYMNASEILSMGIERLIKSPVHFARQDPEYFSHVVKALWGDGAP